MMDLFKLIGAAGLVLISVGLLLKNRKVQDTLYISGGVFLELYSLYLGDLIFIFLEIVFIASAFYDLVKQNAKTR
jgi:sulfite exporter TauE/SafE